MIDVTEILLRVLITVASIVILTRLHGLRSFSKMSGFDFAITVAFGSILAGAVTTLTTPLWHYLVALLIFFSLQLAVAKARARSESMETALDNTPLLIMENGQLLEDNLIKGGMTQSDLWAKLREANAYDISSVHAVILENTGDVSVLHGPSQQPYPSSELLDGVRRS